MEVIRGLKIKSKLIVALDVEDEIKALDIVEELKDKVDFYKIGLELYLSEGNKIIKIFEAFEKKVFLDLKLFDIPNTVYKATLKALKLKIDMFTIHALGGQEMLQAAVDAKRDMRSKTKILGVTLLTSMEGKDIGIDDSTKFVVEMAKKCLTAGLDGIICSPADVKTLRSKLGKDFIIVCPGIRLETSKDDQKRTGTPKETLEAGADFLVVGRPILEADNKLETVDKILS